MCGWVSEGVLSRPCPVRRGPGRNIETIFINCENELVYENKKRFLNFTKQQRIRLAYLTVAMLSELIAIAQDGNTGINEANTKVSIFYCRH
jgi:hypothetical protein